MKRIASLIALIALFLLPAAQAQPTQEELEAARVTLDGRCALGESRACVLLGRMYRTGTGVEADLARAHELFNLSCASDPSLCGDLGAL
ncbi:MAG: SEL1-like repeat protein [Maricaulis sp.]|nr:SEL1-like repeat protein [Maricaulis sp.]